MFREYFNILYTKDFPFFVRSFLREVAVTYALQGSDFSACIVVVFSEGHPLKICWMRVFFEPIKFGWIVGWNSLIGMWDMLDVFPFPLRVPLAVD